MRELALEELRKKKKFVILGGIALLVVVFLMILGYDEIVNDDLGGGKFTLTGTFDCMPLKDAVKERGEECVLGFKSGKGRYYGLDISNIQAADTDIKADEAIAVTGFLAPESATSTRRLSDQFEIEGVILVNSLLRTRY